MDYELLLVFLLGVLLGHMVACALNSSYTKKIEKHAAIAREENAKLKEMVSKLYNSNQQTQEAMRSITQRASQVIKHLQEAGEQLPKTPDVSSRGNG